MPAKVHLKTPAYKDSLLNDLKSSMKVKAVVSYLTSLQLFHEAWKKRYPSRIAKSTFIVDLKQYYTDPDVLIKLFEDEADIYEFVGGNEFAALHSKVLGLIEKDSISPRVLYVGSSNLSDAAAGSNLESNVRITKVSEIKKFNQFFNNLIESNEVQKIEQTPIEFLNNELPERLKIYQEKFEHIKNCKNKHRLKKPKKPKNIEIKNSCRPFKFKYSNAIKGLINDGRFRIKQQGGTDDEKKANLYISKLQPSWALIKLGGRKELKSKIKLEFEGKLQDTYVIKINSLPDWLIKNPQKLKKINSEQSDYGRFRGHNRHSRR